MLDRLSTQQVSYAILDEVEDKFMEQELELNMDITETIERPNINDDNELNNEILNEEKNIIDSNNVSDLKKCIEMIDELKITLGKLNTTSPRSFLKLNTVMNECLNQYYKHKKKKTIQTSLNAYIRKFTE